MPNKRKINNVLKYINEHPDEWDQGDWANACGTRFCFAGHAVVRSKSWRLEKDENKRLTGMALEVGSNRKTHISDAATKVLDLNQEEEGALFNGDNTLDDLEREVDRVTSGYYRTELENAEEA